MTLSCECGGDYDWYYEADPAKIDFISFDRKRRVRCKSCNKLINKGADCLKFWSWREPRCDYEEERFGDEVPLSDKFLCEECGHIWLNLSSLGYCLTLGHDLHEEMREYWEMTGFDPAKYKGE